MLRIILLVLFFAVAKNASAFISVAIDDGQIQPIKVGFALRNFSKYGLQVEQIIKNDLNNCGFFKVAENFEEKISLNDYPNFVHFVKNEIAFLLVGEIENDDRSVRVKFRIWNIFAKKYVAGKSISFELSKIRQLSHTVSDYVYKAAIGEEGYFNTRILYVAESGPFNKRVKRLAIMDYDSENLKYITDGRHMMLSPKISFDHKKILYISYEKKIPQVHMYDIEHGRDKKLSDFNGITSAPRFGYGNEIAVLSLSAEGATNIFKVDLRHFAKKQLTTNSSINTSPSYSPDNKYIVFSSDRGGGSGLYVMRNDGSDQKKISSGPGNYFDPVWSPNGEYIAFTKISSGTFYIGIMRPNGSGEKILASGYMLEAPSWAPNSRLLVFTSSTKSANGKNARSRLYMVDITGKYHAQVKTQEDATDPMWSSRIS